MFNRSCGLVVRASAAQSGGRGFESRPGHTKDFKKWYLLPSCQVLDIKRKEWGSKHGELPVD